MSEPIDRLLKRMDASPGFACLGGSVQAISRLVDDDGDTREIVTAILRDPALTAKLLQVANSSRYARSGKEVTTIAQALTVLGLSMVKSIALSLALLNSVPDKAQAAQGYAEIVSAFFCGSLAAEITRNLGAAHGVQEAQICGLMQNLGRMMALIYLYDDIQQVRKLQLERNIIESEAVKEVLGGSLEDIGIAIVRHWDLPEVLQKCLAVDDLQNPPPEPANPTDWHRLCSFCSRHITDILFRLPANRENIELPRCIDFFQRALKINAKNLMPWIEKCMAETDEILVSMSFPGKVEEARKVLRKANERAADMLLEGDRLVRKANGEALIDVLKLRMRQIHDHCGFDCTLICLPSGSSGFVAMAGVGRNAAMLTTKFRSGGVSQDFFSVLMYRKRDAFIVDLDAANCRELIPKWYHDAFTAKSLAILPLVSQEKVVGMIYGEYQARQAKQPVKLDCEQMLEWRNQMVEILATGAMGLAARN